MFVQLKIINHFFFELTILATHSLKHSWTTVHLSLKATTFEKDPLATLTEDGKLFTYRHKGFWKCMDTLRDKRELEELAKSDSPPWVYKN